MAELPNWVALEGIHGGHTLWQDRASDRESSMFVGHYAASLALKKFEKRASLGVLFLAVQFVDILFFPLVLLGIERINITNIFGPLQTDSKVALSVSALAAYFLFTAVAFWLDKKRS
jgi:hypothetical protein